MEGVVLQTYGHGNWPTILLDMMQVLRQACDNGLIIINTTQCSRGTVSPIYAVGKELQEIGVIAGHDMTVEAALMKLSYILSKDEWSLNEKREVCIPAFITALKSAALKGSRVWPRELLNRFCQTEVVSGVAPDIPNLLST